jgi:hypothetical protein
MDTHKLIPLAQHQCHYYPLLECTIQVSESCEGQYQNILLIFSLMEVPFP